MLLAVILGLAAQVHAVGASPAAKSPGPAPVPKLVRRVTAGAPMPRRTGAPMPDSVVARVGRDRDITVSELVRAARKLDPRTPLEALTPEQRRQFLDVVIDRAVLVRAASRETWTWTAQESARVASTRDRETIAAVLDSVTRTWRERRAAAGDTALTRERIGVLARDSSVAHLEPRFDQALLRRLAIAFDSLPRPNASMPALEQIRLAGRSPQVNPADSAAVLAETHDGPYLAGELLDAWRRLNPLYRPRVSEPSQVADLARNGMFERLLRRIALAEHLERRPEIARRVADESEFVDVSHYVQREVYDRIPTDSLTLQAYFDSTRSTWDLPPRARILRLDLADSLMAQSMMRRLRSATEAESLDAIASRANASFRTEINAVQDSALYARAAAAGEGAVPAPWREGEGWRVIRVEKLMPARPRTFAEARDGLYPQWINADAERRMRALLDTLRERERIQVNAARLERPLTPAAASP